MIYRIVRFLVGVFLRLFNHWEVQGRENIPLTGPFIVAANHVSEWDPPIVACSIPRVVHFMAKEELFKIPLFSTLIRYLNAFPVKRGKVDRNALKKSSQLLAAGEALGLFPEGTRSRTGELLPFQHGAALFALRAQVPVIPVGLIGTNTAFPAAWRGSFTVRIGKPLTFPELYGSKLGEAELEIVSSELRKRIEELIRMK